MEKNVIDFQKLIYSENVDDRIKAAKAEKGLDVLIHDPNWIVRSVVAEKGFGLEMLINDPHWGVRTAVAEQGYGLDILINDKDWGVRSAVVRQGYGLDILKNDSERYICELVKKVRAERDTMVQGCVDKLIADSTERSRTGSSCERERDFGFGK